MKTLSKTLFFALLTTLLFSSCSPHKGDVDKIASPVTDDEIDLTLAPDSDAKSSGRIMFDGTLSSKERGAIVTALDLLDANPLMNASTELLRMMKVNSGDSRSIRAWLEERVQYILTPRTNDKKIVTVSKTHEFENPGIFPKAFLDLFPKANAEKGMLIMSNPGAVIYLIDKKNKVLRGLLADGIGTIPFSSPRAGIIMIDKGLLVIVHPKFPNAAKAFQLATLLHEARHSDGNKETTGFLHAKCPKGHKFEGLSACDDNLNGPYSIDSLVTKALLDSCEDCSAQEEGILRVQYLEYAGRVLPGASAYWDDAPEGQRQ